MKEELEKREKEIYRLKSELGGKALGRNNSCDDKTVERYFIYRGYQMSVGVILNLLTNFNKFSNEPAQIQYSIYHIPQKL